MTRGRDMLASWAVTRIFGTGTVILESLGQGMGCEDFLYRVHRLKIGMWEVLQQLCSAKSTHLER